jgi:TPP-dependent pyruvate/acetoin dehydrogenase alpha subunit
LVGGEHMSGDSSIRTKQLWRSMLLLRAFDERAVASQRQGRIGTYPTFFGEEAIQAAAALVAREDDWLFITYRQNALPVLRGLPVKQALLYYRGDPRAFFNPVKYRCSAQTVPLATHLPHAVGWALGKRYRGEDSCAIAFLGDGASSEGDAHEAMNLASVWRLPVVFLLTNNQWAISTHVSKQTALERLSSRGQGYAMSSVTVDGFDAIAVLQALQEALARAREGQGPSLVEAYCYRLGPHATADDPNLYRDPQETKAWMEKEPLSRIENRLLAEGQLTQEEIDQAHQQVRAEMAEVARSLDHLEDPDPSWITKGVLLGDPRRLWSSDAALSGQAPLLSEAVL